MGDVRVKFIDWFAGIGGFRRGMELAGHECVGFCEFDRFATASYTSMHLLTEEQRKALNELPIKKRQKEILKDEYRNGEWYANDIRRVCADDIPRADCWCFGFPCQDISVAGKQLGFQGNRSSLFFRVMYLVGQLEEENKPFYLFIENVKNLLSVNGGWDFARLLIEMEQGGYDAEWQVLNSKDFGVPQNRERCFIVGHLRGRGSAEVFPVEGTNRENSVSLKLFGCINGRNSQRDRVYDSVGLPPTISTKPGGNTEPKIPIIFDTSYIGQDGKAREYEGICPTLTSRDYKEPRSVAFPLCEICEDGTLKEVSVIGNVNPSGGGMNGNVYDSNGLNPTLTTNKGEGNKIAIPVLTPDRSEKRQHGRRFKEDGEPMFTLTSQDRHGVATSVPVNMTRNVVEEEIEVAHCLNANDSRKFFGKNQKGNAVMVCIADESDVTAKVAEATKQGYTECRVGHGVANTLDTNCNQGIFVKVSDELVVYAIWYEKYQCYIAIRKLTPKECFRLQGWPDDYFEKAQFVNSDSQLYKQAGNGVTVNVIKAIAERMSV